MNKQIILFSVFHKSFFKPSADYVKPIQVRRALATQILDMPGDNTGDNISDLNDSFCELTAIYHIWKNADRSEFDVWGLCHYRRYLIKQRTKIFVKKKKFYSCEATQQNIDDRLDEKLQINFQHIFLTHDAVLPVPSLLERKTKKSYYTLEEHYNKHHNIKDWQLMIQVIKEKYPEYIPSLNHFNQSKAISMFNMMIAKWEIWDGYLTWLFDILFEVKKHITLSEDPYQHRLYGFLSERLINLYFYYNKYNIAYLPVLYLK